LLLRVRSEVNARVFHECDDGFVPVIVWGV